MIMRALLLLSVAVVCESVVPCEDDATPLPWGMSCSDYVGKSCGFDKTDCLSFDPSTNEPIPDYSFSAENGCLTDNDRKQLLKQCPKTCKRCPNQIVSNVESCNSTSANYIGNDLNYVDPIGRDPCSAWATYDCLNYGEEVNEDYYGYSLTTFQRAALIMNCPCACSYFFIDGYSDSFNGMAWNSQPTCYTADFDSDYYYDRNGNPCESTLSCVPVLEQTGKMVSDGSGGNATVLSNYTQGDNFKFIDKKGYQCSGWVEFNCFVTVDDDYNIFDLSQVQANCPNSCGIFCEDSSGTF